MAHVTSLVTVFDAFRETAERHPQNAWLCVPARSGRDYASAGAQISYGDGLIEIQALRERYLQAGYGVGHRVALLLENRPEHFVHFWALNGLGASIVPVNPDHLAHEIAYLVQHSKVDLAIVLRKHVAKFTAALSECGVEPPVIVQEEMPAELPRPARAATCEAPDRATEAALIYTSGTTGRPKGCVIDNEFMFTVGHWYASMRGRLTLEHGCERVFVPLPVFHVNAGVNTPTALILSANCLVLPDRFHLDSWWPDIVATRATAMHYLGIMPPLLIKAPQSAEERRHTLKFGLGAGIDPRIHGEFEERFGLPMVEVWGMTETGRFFADTDEPRRIDTRAFGKPTPDYQARVVDEFDREVPRGQSGELVVRSAGDEPRRGFFRGYLNDDKATAEAWRSGWFHTGDVVQQGEDDMLYFVERRKNIIRRSGENISAAEVENGLIDCIGVHQVCVLSVPDQLREEEVMACIVLAPGVPANADTALAILDHGRAQLAYFKLPGWIVFVDALPRTTTLKVQKELIFAVDVDPRRLPTAHDLRALKKRVAA